MADYLAKQVKLGKISLADIRDKHPEYYDEVEDILLQEGVLHLVRKTPQE